jgi:hypothetical protein
MPGDCLPVIDRQGVQLGLVEGGRALAGFRGRWFYQSILRDQPGGPFGSVRARGRPAP